MRKSAYCYPCACALATSPSTLASNLRCQSPATRGLTSPIGTPWKTSTSVTFVRPSARASNDHTWHDFTPFSSFHHMTCSPGIISPTVSAEVLAPSGKPRLRSCSKREPTSHPPDPVHRAALCKGLDHVGHISSCDQSFQIAAGGTSTSLDVPTTMVCQVGLFTPIFFKANPTASISTSSP